MISRLNLSSDPFRNRTLPWTVAVAVSAVSLVALVLTLAQYREVRAQADLSEQQVAAMRAERRELDKQAEEIRQTIPEDQRKALEAAHALVSRKGFSWSQLFSDLEEFMPTSVRVARINVREVAQAGGQTRADLDLTVVGQRNVGNVTSLTQQGTDTTNATGQTVRRVLDTTGAVIELTLDAAGRVVNSRVVSQATGRP